MNEFSHRKDHILAQYSASTLFLDEVGAFLDRSGVPFIRSDDNRHIYACIDPHRFLGVKDFIKNISSHLSNEVLCMRWNNLGNLAGEPEEAYVMGGKYVEDSAKHYRITWTGPWPDQDVYRAASVALQDFTNQMAVNPGLRDATMILKVGNAQVQAVPMGTATLETDLEGDVCKGFINEYFTNLLASST